MQYRFDEPWNGPHNSQLAQIRIPDYQCPAEAKEYDEDSPESRMTSYLAVLGPRTSFPGRESVSLKDISDGPGSVIAVVEVVHSGIHWIEPRDLHVLQMAPQVNPSAGQGISSPHAAGAHVLMCDGSVPFLSEHLPAEELRALLDISDGKPLNTF